MNCRVYFCLVALLLLPTACSSLFYQPSSRFFYSPEQFNLSPQPTWIATQDGAKLHAWHFENTSQKSPKAFIVFFHGNAENLTSHYVSLLFTLEHSFDFLIFDYRGYGLSNLEPSQEGVLNDGRAAISWAHQRYPEVPIIIFAQSLGGAIAMRLIPEIMKDTPHLPIRLVVVDSTFLSYQKTAKTVLSKNFLGWPFQWLSYLVIRDKESADEWVSKISPIPLIVMHGTRDPVIDYSLGEDVFAKASEPKEFWKIDEGTHIDAFHPRFKGIYREKFIKSINQAIKN